MARMARVIVPHYPHHVTQRGNRRQHAFFCDDDYATYLRLMTEFCRKAETRVLAYCLMTNHVHLVMVPSCEDGLSAAVGEAHRRYSRRINFRHGWRGHQWQERFHSFSMDEPHLLATVRYVERNPVAAKLCRRAEDWPWSSASAHLNSRDDSLVDVEPMLALIDDWAAYLAEPNYDQIRAHITHHTKTGRPLGDEAFVRKLERLTGRSLAPRRPGRKKGGADKQTAAQAEPKLNDK